MQALRMASKILLQLLPQKHREPQRTDTLLDRRPAELEIEITAERRSAKIDARIAKRVAIIHSTFDQCRRDTQSARSRFGPDSRDPRRVLRAFVEVGGNQRYRTEKVLAAMRHQCDL